MASRRYGSVGGMVYQAAFTNKFRKYLKPNPLKTPLDTKAVLSAMDRKRRAKR